ncbi:MAG: anti-sigma F factor [Ruminococcus sp.]|nr:anti-sigma F factor [Ruminococcus sp.]MBR2304056.1 anti-sigma F factor [Ruminococcus sp.]
MKIVFPGYSENERFSRAAVSSFVSQLDPLVDELSDIKTAVSEGVTNAIVHAYPDTIGEVQLEVKIVEGRRVIIKIKDKGCGIEDIEKAMEPMFTTSPDEERAGLGFAVMQSFMDSVRLRSRVGKGTVLTLEKTLREKEHK